MKEYKPVALFVVGVLAFLYLLNFVTSRAPADESAAFWTPDPGSQPQPWVPPTPSNQPARPAPRTAGWKLAGQQGDMRFVTIDVADVQDRAAIMRVAAEICSHKPFCYVNFWSDPALTPRRLPLNDAQVAAQIATYRQNTSRNVRIWIWSCAVYPDLSGDDCFT